MDQNKFDLLKSHIDAFTRKDGSVVAAHDDNRVAAPMETGPAEGEVGHEEHKQYGAYFKKGDKVKDGYGKHHEVLSHRGPEVHTTGGSYHPTKLFRA